MVEPMAHKENDAQSLDFTPEVSAFDLVHCDDERDTTTELETHLEQELVAEATPTRRRKFKSKAKQVRFKKPLVESSNVEASEEIGKGCAR
jgi:hypothetical protein